MWQRVVDYYYDNPLVKWVLLSYVLLYVTTLVLSRVIMAMRRGTTPCADRIAHLTLLLSFILITVLPVWGIVDNFRVYRFGHLLELIPYSIAMVINIIILCNLTIKREPPSKRSVKNA